MEAGTQEAMFLSSVIAMAIMFVILNVGTKLVGKETKKVWYKLFRAKKINKLAKDGWEIKGSCADGYPRTLQKDDKVIVL